MRRRRSLTMGDSVGPHDGPPFLAHNPYEHFSRGTLSRRARPLAPSAPLSTGRLKLLLRGSPLYIFRYKFGRDSRSPRLSIGSPDRALYMDQRGTIPD